MTPVASFTATTSAWLLSTRLKDKVSCSSSSVAERVTRTLPTAVSSRTLVPRS